MGTILLWQCYDDLRKRKVLTWLRNTTQTREKLAHGSWFKRLPLFLHYFYSVNHIFTTWDLSICTLLTEFYWPIRYTSVWRANEGRTAKQKAWKQKSGILSQQFSFLICRLEMSTPKSYKYGPETKRLHTQKKGKSHVLSSIVGFITNGLKKLKN